MGSVRDIDRMTWSATIAPSGVSLRRNRAVVAIIKQEPDGQWRCHPTSAERSQSNRTFRDAPAAVFKMFGRGAERAVEAVAS